MVGHWRLINANVNLARARGQRLRDFMKDLLKRSAANPSGEVLEFSFRGAVENELGKMNMRADGRLLFPKEALEFHQARWIADVELVDIPAALVKQYAARRAPIKSMTGYFAQRIHLDGNPSQQLHVRSDLEFKQLAIDAPELLVEPLTRRMVKRRTSSSDRQRLQLLRADFRSKDMKFALQGEVRSLDGENPYFNLTVSGLSAPVPALLKYLPLRLAGAPRLIRAIESIDSGQLVITKAGFNGSLADLRRLEQNGPGKRVWFEGSVRDGAGKLPTNHSLPLRSVQGRFKLENSVLEFQDFRGQYGDSRLADVGGSYDLAPGAAGRFELRARADFNLAEIKEQLKYGVFAAQTADLTRAVQEIGGRSKADLTIKSVPDGAVRVDGKATLENIRLRFGDFALSEINGELYFSPKQIKGEKIRAQLRGSPIQVQLALIDYASDEGRFDLIVDSAGLKAGVVSSLLLDTGSLQDPGIVRGSVRYHGPLRSKEKRILTGSLDLIGVQLNIHPLLQPLRELNGRITIDDAGIDFQNLKALLVGSPASVSGRWRYEEKPQLLFDFAAPDLDVSYLISQIDPEASEFYAKLQALGKITIANGRLKNFEFSDLRTDTTIDHRVWQLTNLTARSAGGSINGITTIFDRPDTLELVTEPKIQAVPIQSFLKWFDITNTEMTGRVNLAGKLTTAGKNDQERKRNLTGAFNLRIDDGTINRMRILVQILNLLDLSRWFTLQLPDLTKQGSGSARLPAISRSIRASTRRKTLSSTATICV